MTFGKYGVAETFSFPLVTAGSQDYQAAPAIVAGDAKVSTDGGAEADAVNIPVVAPAGGTTVEWTASAAEMQGKRIVLTMIDAAGGQWDGQKLVIYTYGHASAHIPLDLSALVKVGIGSIDTDAVDAAALATDAVNEIEAAISAQITADHGTGSYQSVAGSGTFAVVLHTQDSLGNTIPQVAISVRDEFDTTTDRTGTSSAAAGDLPVSLDAGTYQVRMVKSGHNAVATPQEITVSADGSINLIIDPITIAASPDPTKCTIHGKIGAQRGGVKNVRVRASSVVPSVAQGIQQHSETFETLTDENGDFTLDLTRLSTIALTIDYVGYETTLFLVPDLGTQDIATWAPV